MHRYSRDIYFLSLIEFAWQDTLQLQLFSKEWHNFIHYDSVEFHCAYLHIFIYFSVGEWTHGSCFVLANHSSEMGLFWSVSDLPRNPLLEKDWFFPFLESINC